VNEGVYAVGPVEEDWMGEEIVLDRELEEYVEALLEVDDLQRVVPRDINCARHKSYGCKSAAELVDPIYQSPIPRLHQKWKLPQ
jgi:hypothetical protein